MKTNIILLSAMLTAVSFVSCSQDAESVQNVPVHESAHTDYALNELKQQIGELNQSFGITSNIQTRFSLRGLYKFFVSVVTADAVGAGFGASVGGSVAGPTGAAVGAAVVGIGGSIFVACRQAHIQDPKFNSRGANAPTVPSRAQVMSNLIFQQTGQAITKEDSIGYYHNNTIFAMYDDDNNLLDSVNYTRTDLLDSIWEYRSCFGFDGPTAKTISLQTLDNRLHEYLSACEQEDDYATVPSGAFWNGISDEMEMIFDYAQTIVTDNTSFDAHQYTSKYLQLISLSDITDTQKQMLKSAVLVGYASNKLWMSGLLK